MRVYGKKPGMLRMGLLALALGAVPAWASSPWMYGTIVSAEHDDTGGATLRVLVLIDNYRAANEHRVQALRLPADLPVCLDWKRSTLKEAVAAGRGFAFFKNHKVVGRDGVVLSGKFTGSRHGGALLVSTAPAPARPVALDAPECSLVVATLDKPGNLASLAPTPPKGGIDARLVLEISNGRVSSGVAWTPALPGGFWHEGDVAGLKFDAGRLHGSVKVSFVGSNGKAAGASYELQGTAEGGGTFRGTFSGDAVSGRLAVLGQASARPGADSRLWLWTQDERFTGPGGKGDTWSYLSCAFADGKAASGYLCFRKGFVNGVLSEAALTREGAEINGAFTAKPLQATEGLKTTLRGRILDGRFVVATLTVGAKGEAIRAYGFLLHPDAAPVILPGSESGKH